MKVSAGAVPIVSSGSLPSGSDAADHEHQAVALHADEHVGVHVPGGAAHVVDVELLRRGADEHRDLAVAVPAEGGDAARQLVVVLAREDRVDDERLEARVPEAARLGGARVDVGGGEGDLARVQQDRLAQRLAAVLHALLDDLDRDADELQRLLQAHRAQQLARRRAEHVGGDPRRRLGVVEPGDERRDARLGDEADGRPAARRHVAVPRQRVLEALQRRGRRARPRWCATTRASPPSSWASSPPRRLLALAAGRSGGAGVHVVQPVLLDGLRRERAVDLAAVGEQLAACAPRPTVRRS